MLDRLARDDRRNRRTARPPPRGSGGRHCQARARDRPARDPPRAGRRSRGVARPGPGGARKSCRDRRSAASGCIPSHVAAVSSPAAQSPRRGHDVEVVAGRLARTRRGGLRDRPRQPRRLRRIAAPGNRARPRRPPAEAAMTAAASPSPRTSPSSTASRRCRWTGQVTEVVGLLVESRGPGVAIGDFCEIRTADGRRIRTQVIGFRDGRVLSMPLEEIDGLQLGDAVSARSDDARVEVGPGLLGPRHRRLRQAHGRRSAHRRAGRLQPARRARQPAGPRAHHAAAGHRHPRHRCPAALRQGPAHRHFRRQRRRQEHAARVHVPPQLAPTSP